MLNIFQVLSTQDRQECKRTYRGSGQAPLTIKGAASPACFLACFAAFFSFGESKACFFKFLVECGGLDMGMSPDHVEAVLEAPCKA